MSKTIVTGSSVFIGLLLVASVVARDQEAVQRQAELDAACEEAREHRLAPERRRHIDECVVRKQKPDRAACERFYSDYGAQSGSRAPLYYDLPACVEAFEYRKKK
jgi:hypothetical protein